MPKIVDHAQRRGAIADALLRVASRDGLEGVSLRHVAAEAGVTAGMVQHYFPSKDAMMQFAMQSASARYEARIATALGALGEAPSPRDILAVLLHSLLPTDDTELDDARVGLAFQAYAVTNADAARTLHEGNQQLRAHLADLVRGLGVDEPLDVATALLGAAEGLAIHVLSSWLSLRSARRALDRQLDVSLGLR